jgi:serine/threonine protein phosphatase PrpC
MEVRFFAATDLGRKRSANEDNFLVDQNLRLFVVADGMGGHASGEVASALAVHAVRDVVARERDLLKDYDDEDPRSHVEVCTLLEYAVHCAGERIHEKAQREPEKRGMGTTIVVLLLIGARGFIAYVGDSRICCAAASCTSSPRITASRTSSSGWARSARTSSRTARTPASRTR